MHASIWTFAGDPDELLRRYDAMLEEIPRARMRLHVCLGAPDGIVLVDTCPTKDVFESFARGDDFRALRERHGCPSPANSRTSPCVARSSPDARSTCNERTQLTTGGGFESAPMIVTMAYDEDLANRTRELIDS